MDQRTRTGSRHRASTPEGEMDRTPAPPGGGSASFGLGSPTLSDIMGTMFVALTAPEVHGRTGRSGVAARRSR